MPIERGFSLVFATPSREGLFQYAIANGKVVAVVITATETGDRGPGRLIFASDLYRKTAYVKHPDGTKEYLPLRAPLMEFVDGELRVSELEITRGELSAYMKSEREGKYASIDDLIAFVEEYRRQSGIKD